MRRLQSTSNSLAIGHHLLFARKAVCISSTNPQQSAIEMTLPLGVRYYILRNNVVVPLVPVDQLPLQPRDLPHQLTPCQMNEAGWKFVGETQEPPSLFSSTTFASQSAPPTKTQYLSPDHNVRKELVHAVQELQFPREGPPASSVLPEHSVHHPIIVSLEGRPASVADITAPIYSPDEKRSDRHAPLISQVQPAVRQKEYCDFWMRTGECNYADFTKSREGRGCIYKHEMPSDRNKLRELGFPHGIPRWYREKTAIAAAGGLKGSQYRMSEDNYMRKISDEPRESQSFDPSSFAHARNPPHDQRKSDQTDIEASRLPLVIGDLISFDESPIASPLRILGHRSALLQAYRRFKMTSPSSSHQSCSHRQWLPYLGKSTARSTSVL